MVSRPTWPEIRQSEEFVGLWVALDECRYDARTALPLDGFVVDADEDLAALCSRMQGGETRHCAVVFCDGEESTEPLHPDRARISAMPPTARGLAT
jgi:hypothetical protein